MSSTNWIIVGGLVVLLAIGAFYYAGGSDDGTAMEEPVADAPATDEPMAEEPAAEEPAAEEPAAEGEPAAN